MNLPEVTARGPWDAMPDGVRCEFVDGKTAERHEAFVELRAGDTWLSLCYPDETGGWITTSWPLSHLRTVDGHHKLRWGKAPMGIFTTALMPHARLYVRDGVLLREIRDRAQALSRRPPITGRGRLMGLIGGAVGSIALIVFFLIPLIADQLAMRLPVEGERALGDKTYDQIRQSLSYNEFLPLRECFSVEGSAALRKMRDTLITASDLKRDAVRLSVLDMDMVNAFALPGGRVVVMRGLIDAAETPEEVAAVIAHEIGHVVHRDPTRHALRGIGTFGVLSLVFGDFAGGTVVLLGVNQLVNAQYSQEAESAADAYAHRLLPDAGISPGALAPLFERLKAEHGDAEGIASHLASHPKLGDRVDRAQAAALTFDETQRQPILSDGEWQALRQVCD